MRVFLLLLMLPLLAACNLSSAPSAADTPTPAAQTCSEIVGMALDTVGPSCDATGRNQACYGYQLVDSQFRQGVQATFESAGDMAALDGIRLISTSPLNEAENTWGVAIMKAQADLPETLPGQNVTFLLYGGATIDNVSPSMETIILSTGLGATLCAEAPAAALLMQSPQATQVSMNINGASVSFGSTLHLTAIRNSELTIATISGVARVEAFGSIQTVNPGAQVRLPLGAASGLEVTGPPSPAEPFDLSRIQNAPFSLLDDPVQIPPPIQAGPTATPTLPGIPVTNTLPPVTIQLPPTSIPPACVPRGDWAFTYTIQVGDTLFSIAQRFGLSVAQLQSGNCIADANRISAGQVLRVPVPLPTNTPPPAPSPTATQAASPTPTDANFRADDDSLAAGECTVIRWDVDNIDSVFFEGNATTGHNSQEVCPQQTTRYTLLVIHPNGDQVPYFLTVNVDPSGGIDRITS